MSIFSLLFHFHQKTDFSSTTIFSSKMVIFSTSLLASASLYSVTAAGISSRKVIMSFIRACRSVLSAAISKDVLPVSSKVIDLKTKFIHQGAITGVVDQLLLKLCKLFIDCRNPCFQVIKDRFLNVRFQKRDDGVPSCIGIVDPL